MTINNQNFSMYSGETKKIVVSVTDDYGNPLDVTGATITWALRQRISTSSELILINQPNRITISGTAFVILLLPTDTQALKGAFYHECKMIDSLGNESVLFTGNATILVSNL